jgi:orotate phosphoribosyltransferase
MVGETVKREGSNMNDSTIMQMFTDVGAIVTGSHFVYTSGRHSSVYINKDALYLHTGTISALCKLMVKDYDPAQIDVVVGPVLGGIVLSQWAAHHLNQRRAGGESLAIYAEKASDGRDKQFFFGRGYNQYIASKNILVVEDVLTTGGSARQVIELVRELGGNVVALSALCNRGNVCSPDVGNATISALVSIDLDTYAPEDCSLCRENVPINTELGKGKSFLAR